MFSCPPWAVSATFQLQPRLCTDHSEICTFSPTLLLSSAPPCPVSAYRLHLGDPLLLRSSTSQTELTFPTHTCFSAVPCLGQWYPSEPAPQTRNLDSCSRSVVLYACNTGGSPWDDLAKYFSGSLCTTAKAYLHFWSRSWN